MPMLDLRPGRLDLTVRRGEDHEVVLAWFESLDGRTFEATMGAEDLEVVVGGSTMTIDIPAEATAAVGASGSDWVLREILGAEDQVILVGRVTSSLAGNVSQTRTATVSLATGSVTVEAIGGLATHFFDPIDAHDASAISTTAIAGVSGSQVQANLASIQANVTAEATSRAAGDTAEAAARVAGDAAEAAARTAADLLKVDKTSLPWVSADDFAATGAQVTAFGDGSGTTLATFYPGNLAAAQVAYPHATALTDTLDWAILQAAANGTTSAGSPASVRRTSTAQLFIPAGTYHINRPVVWQSVENPIVFGAGIFRTKISLSGVLSGGGAAGTFGLEFNGVSYFDVSDLSIQTGGGSGVLQATGAILVHFAGTLNGSTGGFFRRIGVRPAGGDLYCGIAVGTDNTLQNDNITFEKCSISGLYDIVGAPANSTTWQRGISLGPGTGSNTLDIHIQKTGIASWLYGVFGSGVTYHVTDFQHANNGCDFNIGTPGGEVEIQGGRSEGAGRLFVATGPTSAGGTIALRDIQWNSDHIFADGWWVMVNHPGVVLENVALAPSAALDALHSGGTKARILINQPSGGYATAIACSAPEDYTDFFQDVPGASSLTIVGYKKVNSSGQVQSSGCKGFWTNNAPDPTAGSQQVATAAYVDALIAAITVNAIKDPVRVATTTALPAHTGVGNVLTASANGALSIDGVSVAVNDRVLHKDGAGISGGLQVGHLENGIYVVTATGSADAPWVLTRSADANATGELVTGTVVRVGAGTVNAGTSWTISTTGTITINTTAMVWGPLNSGGIKTTVQPNEQRTLLSARVVNAADSLNNPWEMHFSGSSFGSFYDSVMGLGVNVSRAASGLIWFDQWEQGYHPGGNASLWWGERFSVFRSHSGNVEARLGLGCVFEEVTTGTTGGGGAEVFNLSYDLACHNFSVHSIANSTGTITVAGDAWNATFGRGGLTVDPGSNALTPLYAFRGFAGQVANSQPTYLYVGHGDPTGGDAPGLSFNVSGPKAVAIALNNNTLATWTMQGPSLDIPKLQYNTNTNLGGVLDLLQPPAGSGLLRGLAIRESATPDGNVVEITKSNAAVFFSVNSTDGVRVGASVNLLVGTFAGAGGGAGVIGISDQGVTVPVSNPTFGGVLYSEAGALKWRGSGGTVTVLAPA